MPYFYKGRYLTLELFCHVIVLPLTRREPQLLDCNIIFFVCALPNVSTSSRTYLFLHFYVFQFDSEMVGRFFEFLHQNIVSYLCSIR